MWLSDEEQKALLDEMPGPITEKIDREISRRLRPIEKKIEEHDGFIASFREAWNRGMGAVTKAVKG